jgi:methionyl-tRNA formyltransferase
LAEGFEIPLVVTRPTADTRAKKQPPRPVFDWASQAGLEILEPPDVNALEVMEQLSRYAADVFFVCDYGQILSKQCLATAGLGGINLHGSLLPRHRGAAPVQWTLLRGDRRAGVTVIHMTPRLDAGPALSVASLDIGPDETAAELESRLAELGVRATLDALEKLRLWDGTSAIGEIQDDRLATRAPRLSKADGALDFRLPAEYLVRLIRACQPWPGTYAELIRAESDSQMRLIVHSARAIETVPDALTDSLPGTVLPVNAEELGLDWQSPWQELIAVKTGAGALLIRRIQPAGKRAMEASAFLRGHPLHEGFRFALPEPPMKPLVKS